MKRTCTLFTLVATACVFAAAPVKTTVHELLTKPALDKKTVQVSGVVQDFRQKDGRSGGYYVFKLAEKKDSISVFGHGKCPAALKNGAKALVIGEFARERHVGDRVYKNEVEVSESKSGSAPVRLVK